MYYGKYDSNIKKDTFYEQSTSVHYLNQIVPIASTNLDLMLD